MSQGHGKYHNSKMHLLIMPNFQTNNRVMNVITQKVRCNTLFKKYLTGHYSTPDPQTSRLDFKLVELPWRLIHFGDMCRRQPALHQTLDSTHALS